ncbi:TusE/DsrC/DsvC family sulfur relay protein [Candidatus Erwinia haradaeae]|uniref:Sulfurtransferase n=1 Tax=Candidatus Erwinia haradaeae TaxID=1922217 RepID=A0A803FTE4_9GAMM|nr:TusE/DsrC/DsvC family sulfur relay protein [Candidatus Erwinia haradaeae]VFP87937.1 Sulfurtransferase TusE [Candidatus Erwinia haradaeae]
MCEPDTQKSKLQTSDLYQERDRDKEGYLVISVNWTEDFAKKIAKEEGINLNLDHWEIIYLIRNFYLEFNISPTVHMLVKVIKKRYGEEKGNSRYLFRLFPKGPVKQATKIAGLPKPNKCL